MAGRLADIDIVEITFGFRGKPAVTAYVEMLDEDGIRIARAVIDDESFDADTAKVASSVAQDVKERLEAALRTLVFGEAPASEPVDRI